MATAGPNASGTQASTDRGALNPAWGTPGDAASSNNTRAQSTITSASFPSDYLDLTNFGFSVSGTINGVTVTIERRRSSSLAVCQNETVQLIKGGTASGTNKADTATNWPTADASVNYGGVSDLWGLTLTASDVNASNFGVRIAAKASSTSLAEVDFVSISIDYTAAASTTRLLGLLGVGT